MEQVEASQAREIECITRPILGVYHCRKHSAGDVLSWEADALPTELLPRGG